MTSDPWPSIGRSYDAVAPAYERRFLDELDGKARDRELLAAFVDALPPGAGPVLDVGCGPGQVGAFVRRLAGGRRVIGVDVSAAMAALAAARLGHGLAGDVRHLPLASATVAGAVAFYSLIHLRGDEVAGAAAELRRVLQPGGKVLASFHEGDGEIRVDESSGSPFPSSRPCSTSRRSSPPSRPADCGWTSPSAASRTPTRATPCGCTSPPPPLATRWRCGDWPASATAAVAGVRRRRGR